MRLFAILLALFLVATGSVHAAGVGKDTSFESISNYYARVLHSIVRTDGPFVKDYAKPLLPTMLSTEHQFLRMDVCIVDAPLYLVVSQESSSLIVLANLPLRKYLETNAVQRAPKLSISEAITRAKTHLWELDVELPTNCVIKKISFGGIIPSQWGITWIPSVNGYTYDEFIAPYAQGVGISFHEEYGLCGYSCDLNFPAPSSTLVKVAKEDAIERASKVAPLVMKTPFYQSARASGFKITGVKNAELKIAAPNWLLDPARAVWIREKPPEETRLCWVVTFVTVDTIDRKGIKLAPVNILVYIDADTGEVVGANFS